jgi:predicted hotdog family 3-hydroxylacyl-ACP dehydratase
VLIEKEELKSLIPHRGRMLLLSKVNEYNLEERNLCAEYHITEDCLFFDPSLDGVPAWAGFEFIAQAISVFAGIRNRARGAKPNMGFILSIPSMKIEIPVFKPGSRVELRVRECDCVDMIYSFEGEAFLEGKKALEGKLMVMEIDEEKYSNLAKEYNSVE